ncbi:MAG: YggS family pyridoxal phosphate-dependent enzyme [Clostridiales bacterium]|nr:YggS family pyridoxal phosphate-dependent enzyme [Clostridiales bacterium]
MEQTAETLKENVQRLYERVEKACAQCGRRWEDIRIVAATKCVPQSTAELLPALGISTAGENRVQEFTEKYRADTPLCWHIIGALQTNKVKYAVGKVQMIQSVDRISLLDEIDRLSGMRGVVTDILLEVNIGGEENKSGVAPEEIGALAQAAAARKNVRLCGLMSVPPVDADIAMYERMRTLYERLQKDCAGINVLSMGMSNDLEKAIYGGATMIRPGRALFGARG